MSNRIARINEEFLRTITSVIPEIKDPRVKDHFLSVVRCDLSTDLKYARVYISVLGEVDSRELLAGLNSSAGFIKREIGSKMLMRAMPELRFILDDSIEQGAKISEMLRKINGDVQDNPKDDLQGGSQDGAGSEPETDED